MSDLFHICVLRVLKNTFEDAFSKTDNSHALLRQVPELFECSGQAVWIWRHNTTMIKFFLLPDQLARDALTARIGQG